MLSKYSSVEPDTGVYRKPERAAVVYGSLTYVRYSLFHSLMALHG